MYKIVFLSLFAITLSSAQEPLETVKMKFSRNVKSVSIKDDCSPENNGDIYRFNPEGQLAEEIPGGVDDTKKYMILYSYKDGKPAVVEQYTDGELIMIKNYEYSGNKLLRYAESGGESVPVEELYEYDGDKLVSVLRDYDGDILESRYGYSGAITVSGGLTTTITTSSARGDTIERIQNDGEIITYEESVFGAAFRLVKIEAYDTQGHLVQVSWPGDEYSEGTKDIYEYDGDILVHEEQYDDGELVAETFYDIYGNIIMETNNDGSITEYINKYNEHSDLIEVHAVAGGETLCSKYYTYEYW